MARIRTIKPEFWSSEDMAGLCPNTKLLAIALLNYADDEGYFKSHPALIKSFAFPFQDASTNVPAMLESLREIGYLDIRICDEGKQYAHIINFNKHQRVDKPKASEIAPLSIFQDDSTKAPRHVHVGREGKGKEGKGKEGAQTQGLLDARFEQFYEKYPRKIDKKKALAAFVKIKPDDLMFKRIMRGVQNQIDWRSSANGAFRAEWKHPTTWLNGENWNDELSANEEKSHSNDVFDDWESVK